MNGHVISQYNMALFYASGYGVEQSKDKALYWAHIVKENGHPDASRLIEAIENDTLEVISQ